MPTHILTAKFWAGDQDRNARIVSPRSVWRANWQHQPNNTAAPRVSPSDIRRARWHSVSSPT